MAAERAVRGAQATLLAAADIGSQPAKLQIWGCQNWKGAGWPVMRGDNPLGESSIEAHGVQPWLPGGSAADDELVRLQRLGDAAGFAARIKELYKTERRFEAPGLWGRFNESRVSPTPVGQLSTLFVDAKKGDLVMMTSSGKHGDPELQVENTRYVIGVFTTDPVPEGIVWRTPEEMGVHQAVYAPGELEKHCRERATEDYFKDVEVRKEADGRFTRVLEGPLATRPVHWLLAGRLYDLSKKDRKYLSAAGVKTIAPMYNYSVVKALIDKGSRIVGAEAVGKRIRVWWPSEDKWFGGEVASFDGRKHGVRYDDGDEDEIDLANHKFEIVETAASAHDAASDPEEAPETASQPAPPPPRPPRRAPPPSPRAPRRAPPPRPQPAGARIRVGAIVKATLHAWPRELKKHGPRFRARGRVVEQGTTDELDDDCPEELRKGRVWHVHYDVDKEVFPTPECCLSVVAPPRPPPDARAAPATPDADRAPGAPVTPEDEDGPPPGATAAAPGSIMATFQCQLSDTLWSKQQILSLMPNEQGSHIPAVYAAGGVIYALCFSEDANPSLPTVLEISCGTQRKRQVALFSSLKQKGSSVPLFVCLQTALGRLELLPGGSGSKGFRFAGMRSVASVQIHSTPKMVGGEARQATVTLSAPTAGGTCPLQVAGIPRAIQVVGAPVTPEDDDDEPEIIETRGPKKRAREGSTLRDFRDEAQAAEHKKVKDEKIEAQELAHQLYQSENNKMSEIDELKRAVSERDSRIEALEAEARKKDATIAELRGRMGQLDDALAAVDAIRNRPRV